MQKHSRPVQAEVQERQIITRAEAKALGLKRYFTGKPCKRGHVAERYSNDQSCVSCKAEDRAANKEQNAAYFREWRKNNPSYLAPSEAPEIRRARDRAAYAKNPEAKKESARKWRKANPQKVAASIRKYYSNNKQAILKYLANKYKDNREIFLEKDREWREKNVELHRANAKRWRESNPDKARISSRNKRCMRKSAEGRHTLSDINYIRRKQNGKCVYCKVKLCFVVEHVDHIIAISKGGSNWPSNIQLLCAPCNMKKHNKHPIEFANQIGLLL